MQRCYICGLLKPIVYRDMDSDKVLMCSDCNPFRIHTGLLHIDLMDHKLITEIADLTEKLNEQIDMPPEAPMASPQIDIDVAVQIMGYVKHAKRWRLKGFPGAIPSRTVPPFSTDLDSAQEVIQRMKTLGFNLGYLTEGVARQYTCQFIHLKGQAGANADTPELAICHAALKAISLLGS
jgi:hypothetical protein